MSIKTDSTPLEAPKNPDTDNTFAIYRLLASPDQITSMRKNYEAGNYGYGHAKQELLEIILTRFAKEREAFQAYINDPDLLEKKLQVGEEKARSVATAVLGRVRKKLGFC